MTAMLANKIAEAIDPIKRKSEQKHISIKDAGFNSIPTNNPTEAYKLKQYLLSRSVSSYTLIITFFP